MKIMTFGASDLVPKEEVLKQVLALPDGGKFVGVHKVTGEKHSLPIYDDLIYRLIMDVGLNRRIFTGVYYINYETDRKPESITSKYDLFCKIGMMENSWPDNRQSWRYTLYKSLPYQAYSDISFEREESLQGGEEVELDHESICLKERALKEFLSLPEDFAFYGKDNLSDEYVEIAISEAILLRCLIHSFLHFGGRAGTVTITSQVEVLSVFPASTLIKSLKSLGVLPEDSNFSELKFEGEEVTIINPVRR